MQVEHEERPYIIKYLTSTQSISTTTHTTVTDGTDPWEVPIGANEVWQVEAHLYITDNDTGSDMNGRINGPSGITGRWGAVVGENAQTKNQVIPNAIGNLTQSGDDNDYVIFTGLAVNGATAGDLSVDVRLHTGSATLELAVHSYCIFRRVK